MKKIHLLSALAIGAAIASCTSDDIIDKSALENAKYDDGRIAFVQKSTNMTRATTVAQNAGHYEFGVWGYKTDAAKKVDASGAIMNDYLVAYTDGTTTGINNWYKTLAENASTYLTPTGEKPTVDGDGVSSWFYEGLANTSGSYKTNSTASTIPAGVQALKYWDKSYAYHNYFAYMPYFGSELKATNEVSIAAATTGADITFKSVSSFYTDPIQLTSTTNTQVVGADERFSGKTVNDLYNTEVVNANEANYAANSVEKGDYEKDVPFTFKHVNAKINIAFWEEIPGYKVELIDLVDSRAASLNTSLTAYQGVAFTPATHEQALGWPNASTPNKTQDEVVDPSNNLPLPSYYKSATVLANGVQDNASHETLESDLTLTNGVEASDNTRFAIPTAGTKIAEAGGANATKMSTTHYVLPNWGGSDWITSTYAADYTTKKVAENTGYTLHVSYKLVPEDGSASTEVYDARVWVDPKYCHWEDGKQYTYIFKITTRSNGTTDPNTLSNEMFTDGDSSTPYIDPEDPRVPETPALVPIVFDAIVIADYDDAHTGKTVEVDQWLVTDVQGWFTMPVSTEFYKYTNKLISADDYKAALGADWTTVYTTSNAAPAATVFTASSKAFTVNGKDLNATELGTTTYTVGTESAGVVTLNPTTTTLTVVPAVLQTAAKVQAANGLLASTALGAALNADLNTYKMYVWSIDNATKAWEYVATPKIDATDKFSITATVTKSVQTETWTSTAVRITTTPYVNGVAGTPVIVYKDATDHEITETQFNALALGVANTDDTVYSFAYKYAVAAYSTVAPTEVAHTTTAYGIAKEK